MKTVVAVIFMFFLIVNPAFSQEVAITFDDGPNPKTTKAIVDILRQYNAVATFFVVGKNVERNPSLVAMIVSAGNEIGNHTWSHPRCRHLAIATFGKEVEITSLEIKKVTGNSPKWFRFPYGKGTKAEQLVIYKKGMVPVLWNLDPHDWRNPSPEAITNYVLSQIHSGSIVVLHDGRKNTLKALPLIFTSLKKQGLRTVTLSHYFMIRTSSKVQ